MPNRVLIADDDRAIRDPFDALVLDVMMPDVDGLGVCRVLRADGDRTPILALTELRLDHRGPLTRDGERGGALSTVEERGRPRERGRE